jgi:DNA replication and repair protein RecF
VLLVNDQKKTQRDFIGRFTTVWFSPETINIINGGPKFRREFLDAYFCQININYTIAFLEYIKALEARSRLLHAKDRVSINKFIDRYDTHLAVHAAELINIKQEMCDILKNEVEKSAKRQSRYEIKWRFEPSVKKDNIFDENLVSTIKTLLKESREKDIATKRTHVGPHRDDWTLDLKDLTNHDDVYDLRFYGSRGQKRMSLLILTLAIVSMLEASKKSKPVLLLDDVVSELDDENVGLILDLLRQKGQQSIITSTHDKIMGLDDVNIIRL